MAEHPDTALVRRGYEAFSQGDMDTLRSLMTSDCTHHSPGDNRIAGHHKGLDNCVAYYGQLGELTHGTMRVDLKSITVDGRGHAIAAHRFHADRGDRGIEMDGALFFTIVGGKITDIDECVEDMDENDAFWGQAE
ncbi:nuclear transport factor 2 family protein [Streptomyces sp. Je 1-79]|uniref:nuclear transport factor 2 family protein n=1 Tax=Streptomyces sp. Je 1-79 TaxID=2943847 RepID=UPI0021A867E0|nr:nuclear transport factor 2 family protein [Streptomyces sp. Je 1-79]MCT4357195.1 nuclear transport factor 2 family protein [Streptomyces sp. Je 1-79]